MWSAASLKHQAFLLLKLQHGDILKGLKDPVYKNPLLSFPHYCCKMVKVTSYTYKYFRQLKCYSIFPNFIEMWPPFWAGVISQFSEILFLLGISFMVLIKFCLVLWLFVCYPTSSTILKIFESKDYYILSPHSFIQYSLMPGALIVPENLEMTRQRALVINLLMTEKELGSSCACIYYSIMQPN